MKHGKKCGPPGKAAAARVRWPHKLPTQIILAFLCLVRLSAADLTAVHVHNFGQVNDYLYRGGEPSDSGFHELGAMGIKLVVDLRESGEGTELEKEQLAKLGIHYINIPMKPLSAPTPAQIQAALSLLLHNGSERIFVHCRRGKDRTGTVIACYRIQHDRWDNRKALQEAVSYGMSFIERGMKSYIAHFSPLIIPELVSTGN